MSTPRRAIILALATAIITSGEVRPQSEYSDGQTITTRFAKRLGKLVQAKAVVPMKTLVEQAQAFTRFTVNTPAAPDAQLSPEELYASCRDSVVLVGAVYKCKKCAHWHAMSASGFALSDDGLIVTSRHVVSSNAQCEALGIMTRDGRLFPVKEVVASDPVNDLVILRTDATGLRPLPVAADIPVGAPVYAIHHANPNLYAFTQGAVIGKFMDSRQQRQPARTLAISADYAPGSSGGPILDQYGAVAGIICSVSPVEIHGNGSTNSMVNMVWKYSVPSAALLELIKSPVTP